MIYGPGAVGLSLKVYQMRKKTEQGKDFKKLSQQQSFYSLSGIRPLKDNF